MIIFFFTQAQKQYNRFHQIKNWNEDVKPLETLDVGNDEDIFEK